MIVWAVETLVATTLLMLVVLALRTPVRRSFGPQAAYALWALPVLRMALPPLPESWRGTALPVLPVPEDITVYLGEPVMTFAAEPARGLGWPVVLLLVWTLGAAAFIAWHLVAHGRFCARVRDLAGDSFRVAAGNVHVIETDAAAGPLAFGVWRKYVAFPRDFAERYDPLERDLALAHELGHHARGDLVANWVALVMLALHWFNPVAWRAFRAFRADQEMACDALVLAGRARELRQAYGRAIVKSAHGGAVSAACHLHTINEIKGRLKMLGVHERKSRARLVAGAGSIAALMIGGLGLTASGTQAAERVRTTVESAVGVDLASIALPVPPQATVPPSPPAPPAAISPTDGTPKKKVRVILREKDGQVREMSSEDGDVDVEINGRKIRSHSFVLRGRDGKPMVWDREGGPPPELLARLKDMPDLQERLKNMPQITSRICAETEGKPGEHVLRREEGDKKVTIICTNRIERVAALAASDAQKAGAHSFVFARRAETSALSGLRAARRSVESNDAMSAEQRSAALAGIDQAIRELEEKKD